MRRPKSQTVPYQSAHGNAVLTIILFIMADLYNYFFPAQCWWSDPSTDFLSKCLKGPFVHGGLTVGGFETLPITFF